MKVESINLSTKTLHLFNAIVGTVSNGYRKTGAT